jgi:DNA-binding transcriptional LysR family regulator
LFRVLHPEVEVFMVELERTEQVAALQEGLIHVGIYPDLCTPQDRQFQYQGLFACPMVAVLPPRAIRMQARRIKRRS